MPVADYDLYVSVNEYSAKDAAPILGVTKRRVIALIEAGKLKARKVGIMYIITAADLKKVMDRPPGRPKGTSKKRKKK